VNQVKEYFKVAQIMAKVEMDLTFHARIWLSFEFSKSV